LIEGLTVSFEGAAALSDFTLKVGEGGRVAVIGANGAGKTTLLLAATGVLQSDTGTVSIDGLTQGKKNRRDFFAKTGLLFQNPDDQLFMPTVYDDAAFGLRSGGDLSEADICARVFETLSMLGIAHLSGRSVTRLSGGEKRLAALAGLLVTNPKVLLLDEPTAFLDPRGARNLAEILKGLSQTLIVATHDYAFVRAVCDRVVLIKEGGLFADGAADLILGDETLLRECGL